MSNTNKSPSTPRTNLRRVTTQSTPKSNVNMTLTSTEEEHASPVKNLSREELFENNLTMLFTKRLLAVRTKDAVLKEERDCILQKDEQMCKDVNPFLYSYRRDLHFLSGSVSVDERVALPK